MSRKIPKPLSSRAKIQTLVHRTQNLASLQTRWRFSLLSASTPQYTICGKEHVQQEQTLATQHMLKGKVKVSWSHSRAAEQEAYRSISHHLGKAIYNQGFCAEQLVVTAGAGSCIHPLSARIHTGEHPFLFQNKIPETVASQFKIGWATPENHLIWGFLLIKLRKALSTWAQRHYALYDLNFTIVLTPM